MAPESTSRFHGTATETLTGKKIGGTSRAGDRRNRKVGPNQFGNQGCRSEAAPHYLGALTGIICMTIGATLSFNSLAYALICPAVYLSFGVLEGSLGSSRHGSYSLARSWQYYRSS